MKMTKTKSILLICIFLVSSAGVGMYLVTPVSATSSTSTAKTPSAASVPTDTDPTGQTVKQSHTLELGRNTTLNLIQPTSWSLDVLNTPVITADIPMNLALQFGLTFPLKAQTSYDPYEVHAGSSMPYVVDLNNSGCTPYATIGAAFSMDFSKLNFNFAGLGNAFSFATSWSSINWQKSINIPFFGTNTKLGNWVSYDIYDKYYTLSDLLNVNTANYGVEGGVGVDVQYNLYSYVTAVANVTDPQSNSTITNLRWDSVGADNVSLNIDPTSQCGDIYSVQIGNWVYHIAHEVDFKVWANIGLNVFGMNVINQNFNYGYNLNLGQLTLPEKNGFTFQSNPKVIAGKSVRGVDASMNAFNFDWTPNGGDIGAVGHNVQIPNNQQLQKWFTDMQINAGISAGVTVNFPFNMVSYYNDKDVVSGQTFYYHLLTDSVEAKAPSIDWNMNGFLDLSNVSVMGYNLKDYTFNTGGELYQINNITTPFGTETAQIDITHLVHLDQASDLLNNYLSSLMYGINPDIQFKAYAVLQMQGWMTGDMSVQGLGGFTSENFTWDQQFDTASAPISIPSSVTAGSNFTVTFSNLVYHLKVTPGIKLGVSILGGIIGFDYTFLIPGVSQYLTDSFTAPDFTENMVVNSYGFNANSLNVNGGSTIDNPVNSLSGSFVIDNTGTLSDNYAIYLVSDDLPSGTTGTWGSSNPFGTTTTSVGGGGSQNITWDLTLGSNAHGIDYMKDNLEFKVVSVANGNLVSTISTQLDLIPDPTFVQSDVSMESSLITTPGMTVIVPVTIDNTGQVPASYAVSISGPDTTLINGSSFSLNNGATTTVDYGIFVPGGSSSTPGNYTVNVSVLQSANSLHKTYNKTLIYTVPAFTQFNMTGSSSQYNVVYLKDQSGNYNQLKYSFNLGNTGNIPVTADISVVGVSDYSLNSASGPQSVVLNPGATQNLNLYFNTNDPALITGVNNFEVLATVNGSVVYSQNYTLTINELKVDVTQLGDNNYTGSALTYEISVQNFGDSSDRFNLTISGLDGSAYNLTDATDFGVSSQWSGTGGTISKDFTLSIAPQDITKVLPGPNLFGIMVGSSRNNTNTLAVGTGVIMPSVYSFTVPKALNSFVDTDHYYNMTFTIENKGNVGDNFTLAVSGITGNSYQIISDNYMNGSIYVARGQSVVVTVQITKAVDGNFKPTVTVLNGQNAVIGTVVGNFYRGTIYSPMFLIGMMIVGILVALGAVMFVLYRQNYLTTGRIGRSLTNMKYRMSSRSASKKLYKKEENRRKAIRKGRTDLSFKKLKSEIPEKQPKVPNEPKKKTIKDLAKDESFWNDDSNNANDEEFHFDE